MLSDLRNIHPKTPLAFGNDMSRIVRGIAIILMVCGHSLPGKVNAFAVPLFSFLVGYGYNFARERSLAHGLRRIWHLLKSYWIILFGICLPVALATYPLHLIKWDETLLCAFGLNGRLNFFSWYIYFYIFAMMVMPWLSRLIDKPHRRGVIYLIAICAVCGLGVWALSYADPKDKLASVAYRCLRYLPIVLAGYYLASRNLFSHISYRRGWIGAMVGLALMVSIYFLRGWAPVLVIDLIWAPLFAAGTSMLFGSLTLAPLRLLLTEMGLKSMNIWFLHALFFTHATKKVFGLFTDWIPWRWLFIIAVLALSYLMAMALDWLMKKISDIRFTALFRPLQKNAQR